MQDGSIQIPYLPSGLPFRVQNKSLEHHLRAGGMTSGKASSNRLKVKAKQPPEEVVVATGSELVRTAMARKAASEPEQELVCVAVADPEQELD